VDYGHTDIKPIKKHPLGGGGGQSLSGPPVYYTGVKCNRWQPYK